MPQIRLLLLFVKAIKPFLWQTSLNILSLRIKFKNITVNLIMIIFKFVRRVLLTSNFRYFSLNSLTLYLFYIPTIGSINLILLYFSWSSKIYLLLYNFIPLDLYSLLLRLLFLIFILLLFFFIHYKRILLQLL